MKLRLNQIKYKLLMAFLFISANLILLAGLSLYYFKKAEVLRQSENDVLKINLLVNKLINNDNVFFSRETTNALYFKDGKSKYLDHHRILVKQILINIELVKKNDLGSEIKAQKVLDHVGKSIQEYDKKFEIILKHIHIRGFKDVGLEGQMRYYGHLLEDRNLIPLVSLLMLRRHEKDFFIRKEMSYVEKFNSLCDRLERRNFNKSSPRSSAKQAFVRYRQLFNEIVRQDLDLGLFNNTGMKSLINLEMEKIEGLIAQISVISHDYTESKIRQGQIFFIVTVSFSIILSLVMGFLLAKNLSLPITKLAADMYGFNIEQQLIPIMDGRGDSTEEIRVLQESFTHMATTLQVQFAEIKEKSDLLEAKNKSLNKLNKELDKFIYSASHDLKAPLSSLLGLINLMKHGQTNNMQIEYLTMMEKSIRKLEAHIKEIINYAKNHQLDITWQEVDIKAMIVSIVEMLKYQEGAEFIKVEIEINDYQMFVSDHMRLNMILFNLISNSFKYHDYGKNEKIIRIIAEIGIQNSTITVEDNGMGIDGGHLDKIFNLFYRASERSTGSGLGLYIVKEAVDKLGGQISVASKLAEGTKFVIQLPHIGQTSYMGLTTYISKKNRKGKKMAA